MKKIFSLLIIIFLFSNCNDNNVVNNNPNIPNYSFSVDVNLNLPSNFSLATAGNGILINQQGAGVRGVFLFNTGSGFTAFEATCPNQAISDCSTMTLSGINAICPCDNKKYSLYSGQSSGEQYPMKSYRIETLENIIRISN